MKTDWNQIRREYITTRASYRDLAKKFGISFSFIAKKSRAENWPEQRAQYIHRLDTKVEQKAERVLVDQTARLYEATDKLLNKVFQLLDMDDALAPRDLKSLSSTLTDIKMLRAKDDSEVTALENQITVKFVGNDWDGDSDA